MPEKRKGIKAKIKKILKQFVKKVFKVSNCNFKNVV